MPDPTPNAATPAASTPAASTPPAAPAAEPKKSSLLSSILGLVEPEKVDVKPTSEPTPEPAKEPAKEPVKPAEPAAAQPTEPPKDPAKEPTPEPKKVVVKRKETPTAPTADEVRRIAAEEAAKAAKASTPTPPAPVVPTPPDDSDLTLEERDELELAQLAEAQDPARKGLSDKFRKFYQEQKKFLEQRAAAEGEGYDPSEDPEYKKFVARNEPKLPASERKKLREEKIKAEATALATKAAEEKLRPEIERLQTKALEIEHRPKIQERVNRYVEEVSAGMPEEIVKFYNENGKSVEKTREAYPDEFDIVAQSVMGAKRLADEALSLRRGLAKFDQNNPSHQFLDSFVDRQAKAVLASPDSVKVRDGKTFVHPYEFTPDKADRHWTFDDEDILESLKSEAQKEAKSRIEAHRKRIKAAIDAAARRAAAPSGTSTPAATPPVAPPPSTRTPPSPTPGVAAAPVKQTSKLSAVLGLG